MAAGLHAPQFASMAQAAQGLVGGINAGIAQVDKRNKDMQRYEANQYVSGLLGEATPENYEANLMKAGVMSPYASPEMIKQADTARAMFQRKEDNLHRDVREGVQDYQWGAGHLLKQDEFDFTKDSWNKDFKFKTEKDARDFIENQRQFGITNQRMYDLAMMQIKSSENIASQQYSATMNKPTPALITTADGKQVVRDVPYSAIIQGGYKDPTTGKIVSIQSLQNVKDTESYNGTTTTKGAQQTAFAKLVSDPVAFQKALKQNLTSSIYGKQWITPKVSDTHMKEMISKAGGAIKASPELQALWNNATTDKQRGDVIKKAAGLTQEETNPFRRIGVGALNMLLPDEYEVDPYRIKVGDKKAFQEYR